MTKKQQNEGITKAALYISGAAYLMLTSSSGFKSVGLRVVIAAIWLYIAIKLQTPNKISKRDIVSVGGGLAILLDVATGYHFYQKWKNSHRLQALALLVGISSKKILIGCSVLGIILATPFLIILFKWLLGTSFQTKLKRCCECKQNVFIAEFFFSVVVAANYILATVWHLGSAENARQYLLLWFSGAFVLNIVMCFSEKIAENRETLFWLMAIVLAASLPIFISGAILGHDWNFHFLRIESIAQGLKNGQLPVRMNGVIDENYGYPVSVFYGDLLLYFPALLRAMGFSLNFAYKTYVFAVNALTASVSYRCFTKVLSKKNALLSTAAYMLASYRLVNIYVRSAVGEYTAMLFYPLILLAMWYFYRGGDKATDHKAALLLATGMTGLLYSHLLSVEMAVIVIAIVSLIEYKKTFTKSCLFAYIQAVFWTLILGASYWVPLLDYYFSCDTAIRATSGQPLMIQDRGAYLGDYFSFFRSYTGGGGSDIFLGERMQLSPGLVLMGALLLAVYLFTIKREENPAMNRLLLFSCIFLWMASNIFPWDWWAKSSPLGKIMSQIQFPWRYIAVACIMLSFLAGYLLESSAVLRRKREILWGISLLGCFLMSFHFMGSLADNAQNKIIRDASDLNTAIKAEYILQGVNIEELSTDITVYGGAGWITSEKGISKDAWVDVTEGAVVEFPAFCYPYYEVTDENGRSYIITEGANRTVCVQFKESYTGILYLRYREPWYWRIAEMTSLIGAGSVILNKKRNKVLSHKRC